LLKKEVPHVSVLGDEIAELRICKTPEEIEKLQHAVDITDAVFSDVVSKIHAGITDYEISALLQYEGIAHGAEKMSFDTIVAIGSHTADPHGRPRGDVLHAGRACHD
jgi:Xaa-Pro aminopeptidase